MGMPIDRRYAWRERPSWRRRTRAAGLVAALASCAIGASAGGEPADLAQPPCPSLSEDPERVHAIYLDLEVPTLTQLSLPGLPLQESPPQESASPEPLRQQRWICPDSALPDAVRGRGFAMQLTSVDGSGVSAVLESASPPARWALELAGLPDVPLELGAFASDGAGFYVNTLERSDDSRIAVLDVDFEVDLPDGSSLWGRLLWNAPWTPDEPPFVPLGDEDWRRARPGGIRVEGNALDLIFGALMLPGLDRANANTWGAQQRVDSILYAEEPARDPRAARLEVAEDVTRLAAGRPAASVSESEPSSAAGATRRPGQEPAPARSRTTRPPPAARARAASGAASWRVLRRGLPTVVERVEGAPSAACPEAPSALASFACAGEVAGDARGAGVEPDPWEEVRPPHDSPAGRRPRAVAEALAAPVALVSPPAPAAAPAAAAAPPAQRSASVTAGSSPPSLFERGWRALAAVAEDCLDTLNAPLLESRP